MRVLLKAWRQGNHGVAHGRQVSRQSDVKPGRKGEAVPPLELDPRITHEPAVDRRGGGEVAIHLVHREARCVRHRDVHEEVLRIAPVVGGRKKDPVLEQPGLDTHVHGLVGLPDKVRVHEPSGSRRLDHGLPVETVVWRGDDLEQVRVFRAGHLRVPELAPAPTQLELRDPRHLEERLLADAPSRGQCGEGAPTVLGREGRGAVTPQRHRGEILVGIVVAQAAKKTEECPLPRKAPGQVEQAVPGRGHGDERRIEGDQVRRPHRRPVPLGLLHFGPADQVERVPPDGPDVGHRVGPDERRSVGPVFGVEIAPVEADFRQGVARTEAGVPRDAVVQAGLGAQGQPRHGIELGEQAAQHVHVTVAQLDQLVQRGLVAEREAGVGGKLGVPGVAVPVARHRAIVVAVAEEGRQLQGVHEQLAVVPVVLPPQRPRVRDPEALAEAHAIVHPVIAVHAKTEASKVPLGDDRILAVVAGGDVVGRSIVRARDRQGLIHERGIRDRDYVLPVGVAREELRLLRHQPGAELPVRRAVRGVAELGVVIVERLLPEIEPLRRVQHLVALRKVLHARRHPILDCGLGCAAATGLNQHHTVGRLHPVHRGGRRVLQNRDALDVFGADGAQRTARRVVGPPDGKTVHHEQRLRVAHGAHAPDAHGDRGARIPRFLLHLNPGDATLNRDLGARGRNLADLVTRNRADGLGERRP